MKGTIDKPAFAQNFELNLKTAKDMMEGPGVKVLVFGVATSGANVMMARAASESFSRVEAEGVVEALQREIRRIEKAMGMTRQ